MWAYIYLALRLQLGKTSWYVVSPACPQDLHTKLPRSWKQNESLLSPNCIKTAAKQTMAKNKRWYRPCPCPVSVSARSVWPSTFTNQMIGIMHGYLFIRGGFGNEQHMFHSRDTAPRDGASMKNSNGSNDHAIMVAQSPNANLNLWRAPTWIKRSAVEVLNPLFEDLCHQLDEEQDKEQVFFLKPVCSNARIHKTNETRVAAWHRMRWRVRNVNIY
jgi:hypothetical protein